MKIFLHYRQSRDLEAMHEELSKTKSELRQTREELVHNIAQKEKISSQVFTEKRFPFDAQLRFCIIFNVMTSYTINAASFSLVS